MPSNLIAKAVGADMVWYKRSTGAEAMRLTPEGVLTTAGAMTSTGVWISGSRFEVSDFGIAYNTSARVIFVAPAPCKVVSVLFNAQTAAATASFLNVEKLSGTVAIGSGVSVQATSFNLLNTANFGQTDTPSLTGTQARLATGERLAIKFDAAMTQLAGGAITLGMEWI